MHAHERLPEEMKVEGKAAVIFRVEVGSAEPGGAAAGPEPLPPVQAVPSHCAVHREAESLLSLLQLPAFPPISSQSLLHPARLSLRYLLDANLPGELRPRPLPRPLPPHVTECVLLLQLSSTRRCAACWS